MVAGTRAEAILDAAIADAGDHASARALVDEIRRHTGASLVADNRVQLLVDGPQTFAAMRSAIQGARHHVHIETYIFADDALGRKFSDLLIEKRAAGVSVRVLYDAIGSIDTPGAFFDRLRDNGVEVREFRPVNPVKTPLLWEINHRDHRKIVIVDGAVGFTGGMNISGTYASSSALHPGPDRGMQEGWRDTQVRIAGPAVEQLQTLFVSTWNRLGEPLDANSTELFPATQAAGSQLVTVVANDGDDPHDRSLYSTYLAAIDHAAEHIWITQAYFAPNEAVLAALIAAVKRGVDVRVIVPGFTDHGLILYASRSNYARLLEAGVHIYERKDALLHAKTAVFDAVVCVVGSANLDMRSFLHNNEVNAIVVSKDFGARMEELFHRDEKAAQELTLASWHKRSLLEHLKEFGSSLLGYWL
jgi:cardiolipin synthase